MKKVYNYLLNISKSYAFYLIKRNMSKKATQQTPEMKQLIKCTKELENIKTQFGYQGSSDPICIAVGKLIDDNTKVIKAHGK